MDLHLTPFDDGVSSRRGSCLAGLQHGIATLTTDGVHTESIFRNANGTSLCTTPVDDPAAFARAAVNLWENPSQRREIARAGRTLYEAHCDWPLVADRLLSGLRRDNIHSEATSHPAYNPVVES
jgi:glycosyltransferase involved in cell wall biosynthesis